MERSRCFGGSARTARLFFGQVDDAWQVALTDVGPVGADKGDGGK
jgi:hypothetical protein